VSPVQTKKDWQVNLLIGDLQKRGFVFASVTMLGWNEMFQCFYKGAEIYNGNSLDEAISRAYEHLALMKRLKESG